MNPAMLVLLPLALPAAASAPLPDPVTHADIEVTHEHGAQRVLVQTRNIAPGTTIPWHRHHGVEIAVLVRGEMIFRIGDAPPRKLAPGDSVTVPRDTPHTATTTGRKPAQAVITLVVDEGLPLREPAQAPAGAN